MGVEVGGVWPDLDKGGLDGVRKVEDYVSVYIVVWCVHYSEGSVGVQQRWRERNDPKVGRGVASPGVAGHYGRANLEKGMVGERGKIKELLLRVFRYYEEKG